MFSEMFNSHTCLGLMCQCLDFTGLFFKLLLFFLPLLSHPNNVEKIDLC